MLLPTGFFKKMEKSVGGDLHPRFLAYTETYTSLLTLKNDNLILKKITIYHNREYYKYNFLCSLQLLQLLDLH